MIRATRALSVLLVSSGCAEWPRFANLPPEDAAALDAPEELGLKAELAEADDEWPDSPGELPASTQSTLGTLWQATRLVGGLDPFGAEDSAGAKSAFADCPGATASLTFSADSDIDWVHLSSDGGPVCLVLAELLAPPDSELDVVLYAFDPGSEDGGSEDGAEDGCVTGDFLGAGPGVTLPETLAVGDNAFVQDVPVGPIALYIAGFDGPGTGAASYTVLVVPATVRESCEALQVTDLPAPAEAP